MLESVKNDDDEVFRVGDKVTPATRLTYFGDPTGDFDFMPGDEYTVEEIRDDGDLWLAEVGSWNNGFEPNMFHHSDWVDPDSG